MSVIAGSAAWGVMRRVRYNHVFGGGERTEVRIAQEKCKYVGVLLKRTWTHGPTTQQNKNVLLKRTWRGTTQKQLAWIHVHTCRPRVPPKECRPKSARPKSAAQECRHKTRKRNLGTKGQNPTTTRAHAHKPSPNNKNPTLRMSETQTRTHTKDVKNPHLGCTLKIVAIE